VCSEDLGQLGTGLDTLVVNVLAVRSSIVMCAHNTHRKGRLDGRSTRLIIYHFTSWRERDIPFYSEVGNAALCPYPNRFYTAEVLREQPALDASFTAALS